MLVYPRFLTPTCCVILACLLFSTPVNAQKGGGKGKPGGDTPPPPVLYQLQRLPMPVDTYGGGGAVAEMNVHNELVGWYQKAGSPGVDLPFYYDATSGTGIVTPLNDIPFAAGWGIPEGWYLDRALGINRHGDVAGMLAQIADPDRIRGFVLELRPNPVDPTILPRLHLLPDEQWTSSYARRINDDGLVLGGSEADVEVYTYRPPLYGSAGDEELQLIPWPIHVWYDNPALTKNVASGETIVRAYDGRVYDGEQLISYQVDTGDLELQDVSGLRLDVRDFNDGGRFCGSRYIVAGKGKNQYQKIGFLFDQTFVDITEMKWANSLNTTNDVVGDSPYQRPYLYHPSHGVIDVDSTVVASSDAEQSLWLDSVIWAFEVGERDSSNFPAIAGNMGYYNRDIPGFYDAFVLIPVELP